MAARNPTAAALFMRRCRQPYSAPQLFSRAASTSPYSPSKFNKHYASPIDGPSPVASLPSNHEERIAKTARASERLNLAEFLENSTKTPTYARPKARPTAIGPAHSRTSFWNYMRRNLGLKIPKKDAAPDRFNVWNNPYRAHKTWPPKLLELNHKQQLHFEKTYRRRANLKWDRPVFKRWVTLLQNSLIILLVFSAIFLYEQDEGTPTDGMRSWLWAKAAGSDLLPERVRDNAAKKSTDYEKSWKVFKDQFFEITPNPNIRTAPPVNPEEEKIPWAQRQQKGPSTKIVNAQP